MPKRILFYTANGVGLGHIRRTSLIAQSIRQIEPKTQIKFITMCTKPVFLEELGFDYELLQPITDQLLKPEKYEDFKRAKLANEDKLRMALDKFKPHTAVVDIHCFSNFTYPQSLLLEK